MDNIREYFYESVDKMSIFKAERKSGFRFQKKKNSQC